MRKSATAADIRVNA